MGKKGTEATSAEDVNRELYVRNAELAVRNKTLSLLHKIDDVTVRALETDEMVDEIVHALDAEFSYPFVAVGLCDEKGRRLVWKAFACIDGKACPFLPVGNMKPLSLASRTNAIALAIRSRRRRVASTLASVLSPSIPDEHVKLFVKSSRVKSTLVLPLVSGDRPVGVLVVGMDRSSRDLTAYERDTFSSLIGPITIAIQKAETYARLQRTTKQLREANHKLRALDAMKTEFLSIASHQLRTPLAVMKGYIGLLKSGMMGPLVPKQDETLGRMADGTEQLILLVNHLLDVSRIESGRLVMRLVPTDIRGLLEGVTKFIQGKAQERGLTLSCEMPEVPVNVDVDVEKVKEVFMNLLDNAVKYTETGGVKVRMWTEGGLAKVSVSDTGRGLTAEDLEKLFQKFVTGSASKHVQTTTGLGLYVVRKLMEAMGGTAIAESQGTGTGSTFILTFPLKK